MNPITKLQALLPEEVDALLVTSELNQRYLSRLNFTDGYLLLTREKAWLLADFRYIEAARRVESDSLTVLLFEGLSATLGSLLAQEKISRLGFESETVTCAQLRRLEKTFPLVDFLPCPGLIEQMRVIKTPEETDCIIAAQRIAEKALERLFTLMKPDMTEIEVALELEYGMRKFGAEKPSFDTIAVSGSASSLPHGVPRNQKLEKGFLTMDFGALYQGYCSDMTRTVVLGRADEEMKKVYRTVLEAQLAALEFLSAGKTGADCDKVARDRIEHAGYGECFGHSLGHGVGMYIHEEPRLSRTNDKPLPTGAVVTVEPGIYLQGRFGVRIEDMVYLSENGPVNLTKAGKELTELF